jgi:hypothetical protein
MHYIHPTEVWRERDIALLREAEERRHVRQLRTTRRRKSSRDGSRSHTAALGRVIDSWGRTSVPFFRA